MKDGTRTPPLVGENSNGKKNGHSKVDDDDDFGFDDSFGTINGLKPSGTLGDMWRENTIFKVGVIAGGIIFVIIVLWMFSGGGEVADPSNLPTGSQVSVVPGTQESTPEMTERTREKDREVLTNATRTGGAAFPSLTDPSSKGLGLPNDMEPEPDPLERLRAQKERESALKPVQEVPPTVVAAQPQVNTALAGAMLEQMTSILESKAKLPSAQIRVVNSKNWLEEKRKKEMEAQTALLQASQDEAAALQGKETQKVLLAAGEIEYAQMLTEANSDIPGPVLAQVASGPLKGSRLIGKFQVENDKYLAITFNTAIINSIATPINAIALDPDTTLPGMATDVDNRYLKRIILPSAAAFVEGFAQAVSESGATTVTVSGDTVIEEQGEKTNTQEVNAGIAEAGQEIGDILSDIADDTKVMVKVHSGTPMGILFLEPVFETDENVVPEKDKDEDRIMRALDERWEERDQKTEEDRRQRERYLEDLTDRNRYNPYYRYRI